MFISGDRDKQPRRRIRTDLLRPAGNTSRKIEGDHDRTDQASAKVAAVLTADAARRDDGAVRLAGVQGECGAAAEGSCGGDFEGGRRSAL